MSEGRAYYNEIDRDAVHVLRSLIADGFIADGDVDDRSIVDVRPDDLVGYTQCHFFAGAGLWSVAARIAGWPDDRPLWTGSCPCQPFSAAGRGLGTDDPRHLWPDFFRLIRACRPPVVMGEQVAGAPGYGWFDGVRADLAGEGFASRTVDIPVCAVDGPHIRQRLYWITVADSEGIDRWSGLRVGDEAGHGVGQPTNRYCPACGGRGRIGPFFPGGISSRCANCAVEHAAGDGREQGVSRAAPTRYRCEPAAADQCIDGPLAISPGIGGERLGETGARAGRRELPAGGHDRHGGLVDASRVGWREGRPEPKLRSGRAAPAFADASGVTQGDAFGSGLEGQRGDGDDGRGWTEASRPASSPDGRNGSAWSGAEWLLCHDGKARRTEPGIRLLVDGMAGRVPAWRLAGNSISPVLAAEVIGAFLDVERAEA
ncbi:DNA cytosine methyltransferase [Bosea sp. UC22_33]|uniref:DNA cytosine methyltransferase n=1 Tax=Bosea sp. UC22_33 TaxID=3350165 RepID=UPI0036714B51